MILRSFSITKVTHTMVFFLGAHLHMVNEQHYVTKFRTMPTLMVDGGLFGRNFKVILDWADINFPMILRQ